MSRDCIKKTALYPYNGEFMAFIKYINKHHKTLQITDVVAPRGWGLSEKDAGTVFNKPELGIKVTDDINIALENCEVLLITECILDDTLRDHVIKTMLIAIESKKDIICTMSLSEIELNLLKQKSCSYGVDFLYCPEQRHWSSVKASLLITNLELYRTKAPVIYIGELVDGLDGFEILLAVTDFLKDEGYKTISIGAKTYCENLGMYSMPDFLSLPAVSENDKIYYFNNYIRYLEEKENPDIFIIQLPGGMMKYNDKITSGFGVLPYLISQAIQGDYFILSSYYIDIDPNAYQMLSTMFYHRFGIEIDCVQLSNKFIDSQAPNFETKLSFIYLDQYLVDMIIKAKHKESNIPVYNLYNSEDYERMFEQLVKVLTGGGIVSQI